jgi:CheY-like chemotaxis protein
MKFVDGTGREATLRKGNVSADTGNTQFDGRLSSVWDDREATGELWESTVADDTSLIEVMTREVICATTSTTLDHARELMIEHGLRAVPVVDAWWRPVGLIRLEELQPRDNATREVLDEGTQFYLDSVERARSDLGVGSRSLSALEITVRVVMDPGIVVLPETCSVARASAAMDLEEARQVLAVDDRGVLTGIVSSGDISCWMVQRSARQRVASAVIPTLAGVVRMYQEAKSGDHPKSEGGGEGLETSEMEEPDELTKRRRKTVLVVEDDAAICESLVQVLEDEGYAGVRALNGREALDLLRRMTDPPCLILLDLMMPEMNGWEFRQAQLTDTQLRQIPVVVLTAHGRRAMDELGSPAAFLRKPIAIDTLLRAVERHCVLRN